MPRRRKWQPISVFLPEKSHIQRSLMGYNPKGHKESDMAERLSTSTLYAMLVRTTWELQVRHIWSLRFLVLPDGALPPRHTSCDSQESTTAVPRTPACSPPSWLAHILFSSCILIWHLLIITLPTKVRLVKAMFSPVVMYGCENWTVKKAERRKIDAFELLC